MTKKSWWKEAPLPFKILTYPTDENVTKWFAIQSERKDEALNDKQFKTALATKGISIGAFYFFVLGIFVTIIFTLLALFSENVKFDINYFWSCGTFFIFSALFWLYSFAIPNKILTLNRFTGIMTYPSYGFYPHFTTTFTRATVYRVIMSGADATLAGAKLSARNPYDSGVGRGNYDLADGDPEEWWSFYVWYMDKNRPLPPGAAFDEYRLQDFERRKAEGFPKPLIPGTFHTPERTPSQHRQCKEIGGW
ncbi:hypothetical protein [Cellulophaga sp. HaHa_2_1]|uniref:hypothetical protein n=1 Tax=Cellulophaga sp. HaHa_2_1 TaxID=2749994 RepID=UPI001C4F27F8|nr:hypothetical protein [Cellulophaga sp. HaHa_2_1]QXP51259.1 hypothetical protein H0I24_14045 [Cellulophaga sp. HaHa_2_1]